MREPLLETLANHYDCFISSLPALAEQQGFSRVLKGCLGQGYDMKEWNDCLAYLYRNEFDLTSMEQVREFIARQV